MAGIPEQLGEKGVGMENDGAILGIQDGNDFHDLVKGGGEALARLLQPPFL
jgi:hypothetical protein